MIDSLLTTFTILFAWFSIIHFFRCRLLRYLRFFQQEEYDHKRFAKWIWQHRAFDKKGTCVVLAWFVSELLGSSRILLLLINLAVGITLCTIVALEADPRKQGKVLLNMTERASRIYKVALAISTIQTIILILFCIILGETSVVNTQVSIFILLLYPIYLFQTTPLYLIVSTKLLNSTEGKRQQRFADDAKRILRDIAPHIIGITGSYGKTSTKNILGQILQITLGPTFWPKKSINTVMGNTREIRTNLRQGHRYAIFEMGAYGRGSITRLCQLTPPQTAIITAIGTAHLERFGSQENIYHAKAELAQVLPSTGILICNGDDAGARRISEQYPTQTTLLYGFDPSKGPVDCLISSWHPTDKGTDFSIEWQGKSYKGFTPLHGKSNLSNIAAAFTCACAHGAHPEYVLATIHTLEPIENRLHVEKREEVTFIHDAYNSNPDGFTSALEVLKHLPGERRILITPGMIELGTIQESENERIGRIAAPLCDIAIIVGTTNQKSLMNGLQSGGLTQEQLLISSNRDSAFQMLKTLQRKGDIVLIENDLTDLYETKEKF